ncbi:MULTISPECIES: glycosyltransferase family 4 protein [Asaia]|uniref:glycosyltransferase family 4 protein n=1 Tax=Asaia TaxID=91914 RepID=UPI002FC28B84
MLPLIICCLSAAGVSIALICHMIRVGVMDVPGHRSSHTRPTPKGGGIGIVLGFLLVFPVSQLWTQGDLPGLSLLLPLLAIALLALFSWLDDIHSYRASLKLGVQAIAALMVLAGMAFGSVSLPSVSPLLLACLVGTGFCWLVYVTNALNFIDGINGLASGSMAISALIMAWLFDDAGQIGLTHAALLLGVCLLAFLPFNFPTARIFMGDVGSQGAGLALSWFGLEASLSTAYPLIMPFLLCGILFDVAFTLVRRAIAGDPLAQAHRSHLYQLATRAGMSPVLVTLIYWFFVIWGGIVCVQPLPFGSRLALLLAPQLLWMGVIIHCARNAALGKW